VRIDLAALACPLGLLFVATASAQAPVCSYTVVSTYPHDSAAFTQGLVYLDGQFIEGTGLYGKSTLRRVEIATGTIVQRIDLPPTDFGEGVAVWQDRIIQLTYQENTAYVWDRDTFAAEGSFLYPGEGWGLTHDGWRLIMSDGTSQLEFRDPDTFAVLDTLDVTDNGAPVTNLNELEWIRGEVFANRWLTDRIARIDPKNGDVIAWIDLGPLVAANASGDVLNGIAWDDANERLFVTGKWWSNLYEIELVGCPPLALFADGFESGGMELWSGSLP
jgi:glutamine cyclotransferase